MEQAIRVTNLKRRFGNHWALRGVTFEVAPREVVGFLGPNGAGKSTTMRILTGYIAATSGAASVAGVSATTNPTALRARIGYLPEQLAFYDEMRVVEYLDYRGRLKGIGRAERARRRAEVIERCGLDDVQRRLIGQLSKGYRQRVGLADALLAKPPVLILDEPTVGLDPHSIREIRQLIGELGQQHSVLLSSHILTEVEAVCQRVVIINRGRIVASGAPSELTRLLPGARRIRLECEANREELEARLAAIDGVERVALAEPDGAFQRVVIEGGREAESLRQRCAEVISAAGWPLRELHLDPPGLEELFVHVTGDEAEELPDEEPPAAAAAPSTPTSEPASEPTSSETPAAPTASEASAESSAESPSAPAEPAKEPSTLQVFFRTLGAQLRRELGIFLLTPIGWIALTIFLMLTAGSFLLYAQVTHYHVAEITAQFFNFVFYWFLILFLPPILTMRAIAEERRARRLELLLTAPTSVGGLLTAKYLAALLFYGLMWSITVAFFATLHVMAVRAGTAGIDWGPVLVGYLGTLSIGAMLLAMSLLASIVARDQLVSAVLAIILTLVTFMVGFLIYAIREPMLREKLLVYSLMDQMRNFSRGIVDSRFLTYNLTLTVLLLFGGTRLLQLRRWR